MHIKKCLVLCFFFLMMGKSAHVLASSEYVTVSSKTGVYEVIDGKQVQLGVLGAGESFLLQKEDEKYYYVKFGNGSGYFSKKYGKVVSKAAYKNANTSQKNSNTVIVTKEKTIVYDGTERNKKAFVEINANMRYPVIGDVNKYWYKVDVGNRIGYVLKKSVSVDKGIPVLMYHHMVDNPQLAGYANNSMVIKVAAFQQQMNYLKTNGWKTISIQELDNYLMKRHNLTGKVAIITFDDGIISTVNYAYPILKQNGQKATSFVIGDRIRLKAADWGESATQYVGLEEMRATNDVFDYQHHTFGMHLRDKATNLPYLLVKSSEEIEQDMIAGKNQIGKADSNSSRVKYLAYPWGQYDTKVAKAVSASGIRMAFTTEKGNVRLGDYRLGLKRQGISPKHTMQDFVKKLNGTY